MSDYDKYKRNSKATAFYRSKQWVRMRAYVFARDNGLCQWCLAKGLITAGDIVHHKIELLDGDTGWSKRLDEDNLITVCHMCHNNHHKSTDKVLRDGLAFDVNGNLVELDS